MPKPPQKSSSTIHGQAGRDHLPPGAKDEALQHSKNDLAKEEK
jgi:hypothetical protein